MENKVFDEEEYEVIKLPYYRVYYKDDWGQKHIATIKESGYLNFLIDRFTVISYSYIKEDGTIEPSKSKVV